MIETIIETQIANLVKDIDEYGTMTKYMSALGRVVYEHIKGRHVGQFYAQYLTDDGGYWYYIDLDGSGLRDAKASIHVPGYVDAMRLCAMSEHRAWSERYRIFRVGVLSDTEMPFDEDLFENLNTELEDE